MIDKQIETEVPALPRVPENPTARGPWGGIGGKLFLSYILVVAVGVLTLFLAVSYLAPTIFDRSMFGMMGDGMGMMGAGMTRAMTESVVIAFRETLTSSLLLASLAGLVAAGLASFFFARRIVQPVRRMATASHRIAAGHYAERVPAGGSDELADLRDSFNQMAASLEQEERRRLELIGDVAHELRSPLTTLEGYAEGLLDGVVEPSAATFALLHGETRRLRRLVDDLQELSRAEARQIPLHPRPVAPQKLVEVATARLSPQFAEKGLALALVVPAGLPAVLADEDRAVQVLTNLLGNALRYTPAGGEATVRVRALPHQVEFAVADTGIGIAPEHLPHLFERFYRVDASRSRARGGSGIGLTITRHLVEAQGGTIRAESPGAGQGSTFTFTLPSADRP